MKSWIYVDNFRGFEDTVISIKDVNFMVGENSSGKSSILSLISLMTSSDFLFKQDFNSANFEFGSFKDIASLGVNGVNEFWVGVCGINDSIFINGYMISFCEEDAIPSWKSCVFVSDDSFIVFRKKNENIEYYHDNIVHAGSGAESVKDIFIRFKEYIPTNNRRWKSLISTSDKQLMTNFLSLLYQVSDLVKQGTNTYSCFDVYDFRVFLEILYDDTRYFAPIRSRPKRTYNGYSVTYNPEGDHIPYKLKKIFSQKTNYAKQFKETLETFGKESGLFSKVVAKSLGKGTDAPFELQIEISAKSKLKISNVGYGVSQILPIVSEMLIDDGTLFFMQQPEVHLHPRAQAAFGDLIYQLALNDKKRFIIETHSDFMIDRFRLNYQKQEPVDAQVLFFERTKKGNKVTPIEIEKNGEYSADQPLTFREFFLNEAMSLMSL